MTTGSSAVVVESYIKVLEEHLGFLEHRMELLKPL